MKPLIQYLTPAQPFLEIYFVYHGKGGMTKNIPPPLIIRSNGTHSR